MAASKTTGSKTTATKKTTTTKTPAPTAVAEVKVEIENRHFSCGNWI